MLKRFSVTNFKGFKNRITLDLSEPRNYEFNNFAIKNGMVKNAIIYGPNGSGKSNLGYAIFDILMHLSQKWKKIPAYDNILYAGSSDPLITFEYTFDFSGQIVQYNYKKNSNEALEEECLFVDNKVIFNMNNSEFIIDRKEFPISDEVLDQVKNNANNISIVNYLYASFPLAEDHYLKKLKVFVDSMLWFRCLEDRRFMGLKNSPETLSQFVIQNNLYDDLSKFLLEVSGQKYDFEESNNDDQTLYCLIEGKRVSFINIISTGTSSLFLLYYWLKNIENTSLVFIDEFDAFYHYRLSKAVCHKLFSLDKPQVILTSHNTFLMSNDILRPDCNFILDNGVIKPLCDCSEKELRFGHNIEKLYRGGAFEL